MVCMNNVILNIQKTMKPPSKLVNLLDTVSRKHYIFSIEAVSKDLCRGSNVSFKRIPFLAKMGIERVINLRTLNKKTIEKLTAEYKKFGIEFYNIPIDLFNFKKNVPTLFNVIKEIAKDPKKTLFHCTHGYHRTGGVVAMARNMIEGLPMSEAIKDMYQHGFKRIHKIAFRSIKKGLQNFEKESSKVTS